MLDVVQRIRGSAGIMIFEAIQIAPHPDRLHPSFSTREVSGVPGSKAAAV